MPRHEHPEETEKGHQGWRNYETWAVALWIDNEQSSQEYWQEIAEECYEDARESRGFTKKEAAAGDLSQRLKDEFEEGVPELENGVYSDLLNAALSEVYWYEIAMSLLDDVAGDDE